MIPAKNVRLWMKELEGQLKGVKKLVHERTGGHPDYWEQVHNSTKAASVGNLRLVKMKKQVLRYDLLRAEISVLSEALLRAQTFLYDKDVYNIRPENEQLRIDVRRSLDYLSLIWHAVREHEKLTDRQLEGREFDQNRLIKLENRLENYDSYRFTMVNSIENIVREYKNSEWPRVLRHYERKRELNRRLSTFICTVIASLLPYAPPAFAGPPAAEKPIAEHTQKESKKEAKKAERGTKEYYQQFKDTKKLRAELQGHPTAEGYVRLGDLYASKKDYDGLKAACEKAIKLDAKNAGAHVNLGAYYELKKKFKDAEKEYLLAIKLDKRRDAAYGNLGSLHYKKRSYDKAIKFSTLALKIQQGWGAYNVRARSYFRLGKFKQALDDFKKVRELNPSNKDAPKWIKYLEKRVILSQR